MVNKFVKDILKSTLTPEQYNTLSKAYIEGNQQANKVITNNIVSSLKAAKELVQDYYNLTKDSVKDLTPEEQKRLNQKMEPGLKDETLGAAILLAPAPRLIGAGIKASSKAGGKVYKTAKEAIERESQLLKGEIQSAFNKVLGRKSNTITPREYFKELEKGSKTITPEQALRELEAKPVDDFGEATLEEFLGIKGESKAINQLAQSAKDGKLTASEEQTFMKLVKDNASSIGKLAEEVGETSAKNIPNLIKFAKDFGTLLKNSPLYVKAGAAVGAANLASLSGVFSNSPFSLYDIYQEFKKNNFNILPPKESMRGALPGIPGSPIINMVYNTLGYAAGDALARAALRKVSNQSTNIRNITSENAEPTIYEKEIALGIRHPGISNDLNEYEQGQSGRKYHVVNDKVYDFGTGRPVNIQTALSDIMAYDQFKQQKINDQLNNLKQQAAELNNAQMRGYQVPPEAYQQIETQAQALQAQSTEIQKRQQAVQPEYNPDGDLMEQYQQRVIQPQQINRQEEAMRQQQELNTAYQEVFNKIAQDTFADLDNYYTPENQQREYWNYMSKAIMGGGPKLSPEEFARQEKMKAMHELAPIMQTRALDFLKQIMTLNQGAGARAVEYTKVDETQRHNQMDEYLKQLGLNETQRHNIMSEITQRYTAESGRMSAQAAMANAQTNRMEIPIKQQNAQSQAISAGASAKNAETNAALAPYKQAMYSSEALYNAGESEVGVDAFLNTNQSVMKQVYPGAFEGNNNQQNTTTKGKQSSNTLGDFVNQVQSWLRGN